MPPKRKPETRLGIQSVEIASSILDALTDAPGSLPLKMLASATGLHPGKVHRYLISLTRTGLVEQDPITAQYGIGPLALKIGLAALRDIDVVRFASQELPILRDEVNETAVLTIWGNLGPTVVRIEESDQAVTMNLRIGTVLPVIGTAVGWVYAAYLPRNKVKEVIRLQRGRVAEVKENISLSSADARAILAETRSQEMCRIAGTLVPGVSVLAAPIFDNQGALAAAVATLGREAEFDVNWDGPVSHALKNMAAKVSRRLGYSA